MGSEEVSVDIRVRVRRDHRVESRRGAVGRIVGCYGGHEHVAVEVRLDDGRRRLFWPGDLKEASRPRSWWRYLFEGS